MYLFIWMNECMKESIFSVSFARHKNKYIILNAAARLIFNEPKRMHVTPLFINLHWLPIAARIKFKALMFAYRTTSGSAPLYLNSLLQTYMPSRSLRSAMNDALLYHPKEAQNYFHRLFHLLFPSGGMTCLTQSEQLNPYPSSRNG